MLKKTGKILAPVAILAVFIAVALLIPDGEEGEVLSVAPDQAGLCAEIAPLRVGDMAKLTCHETPFNPMQASFSDGADAPMTVADLSGKIVVMNFWATWCPPCRAEMPSIDRLAGELSGNDIKVMAVSTDRGGREKIDKFFSEIDIQNLAVYRDKNSELARDAGAMGLPVTLILDRQGREIARLIGEAKWDSAEVKAIVRKLAELTG